MYTKECAYPVFLFYGADVVAYYIEFIKSGEFTSNFQKSQSSKNYLELFLGGKQQI